jgi:2-C-methyl-D-erythritol 4-phosphate cytidylyltransferase
VDRADVAGLIPAAGSGSRLGRGPKAFVMLDGRTLLAWAVEALRPFVGEVVVAVPEADVGATRAATPDARVIAGADTRQGTVARLAQATSRRWVVVHDAARPFLDHDTMRAVTAALPRTRALSVAMPVADSLIDGRDGTTVDRSGLWAVQTPQAFERELLLEAHASASAAGVGATDDAALVRRLGVPVELVPGGVHLLKITTVADLRLAEAYARSARGVAGMHL